ncbi:MAG: FtsX-like permease family protein [Micromonosporaceae bacterium]
MSTVLRERPADLGAGNGGAPARRAVVRWAWRLFRREWRQQSLVLALLTVAVAATILGVAVATNTPPPHDPMFGTANQFVSLPGTDPHLAADIAAVKRQFGTIDVIEHQRLAAGSVNPVELRAQDPAGPYGHTMLAVVSGRYPSGPGEVAVTNGVATLFDLHIGGLWQQGGHVRRVVGLVENPDNLMDEFALVTPGQISAPTQVTILFDAPLISGPGASTFNLPDGISPQTPVHSQGFSPAVVVLALAALGLIFIGLVSVAGFTVMAQRRLRSLGMLSSLGATDRNVRLVMVANGAVVGMVGTLIGGAVGFAAWIAYAPHLQASTGHRVNPLNMPWWAAGTAMGLALVTAVLAARRPARSVARIPVVAALSGRPAPPKGARRSAGPGVILLVIGPILLAFAGGWGGNTAGDQLKMLTGIVATTLGSLLVAPLCISVLSAAGRHAPIAARLALRDLVRYRARSGAALAAVTFAIFIAVLTCILATARYANAVDYFAPNLPANQLVVYAPGVGPGASGPGPDSGAPGAQQTPAELQARVSAIAASLNSHDALGLESSGVLLVQVTPQGSTGGPGDIYVATPAVLHHYGINPSEIIRGTILITSRPGLEGTKGLQLLHGGFGPRSGCSAANCVADPKIQTFGKLPIYTGGPNLLVTTYAVHKLGLHPSPAAWLIQTSRPLTAAQVNTARQTAAAAGMTIETKNQDPSLSQLRNWSTAAGLLMALGVLAMTVGLIRSETASDLRTLTATGASSTTRRTVTGATAGAIGLLGALLGTAAAYLAAVAFYRSSLSTTVSHVPVGDLIVILAGLPLAAAIGGWLFAGREPAAIARRPLE